VQIVSFFLAIGVFVSPVLFPPSMFPPALVWILWLNPVTPAVLGMQSILLAGAAPGAEVWLGLALWALALALLLDRLVARSREQLVDWL
jgi:lipopolysaccharide transport system permease protein